MDLSVRGTENGGIEADQTFLVRKSSLTPNNPDITIFARGNRWEQVYPEVPQIWSKLTIKTVGDATDYSPGIMALKVSFTGYAFESNGSSGDEESVPTTALDGSFEECSITRHKKWTALTAIQKKRLNWLMAGYVLFNPDSERWGSLGDEGSFSDFETGGWPIPTGDELIFATMIAEGDTTFKRPGWDYVYRTESKTGFTTAQLATHGKIVASPQGNPASPGTGWTWQLVGPSQSQSGPDRFIKELRYAIIEDNDKNQMLYGS